MTANIAKLMSRTIILEWSDGDAMVKYGALKADPHWKVLSSYSETSLRTLGIIVPLIWAG